MSKLFTRWMSGLSLIVLVVLALAACGTGADAASSSNTDLSQDRNAAFSFSLVPSPGITACLPKARGSAQIFKNALNDTLKVHIAGLPANTGYDLFVLEIPNKPFGVAWYQSDMETNGNGEGDVSVVGIFNKETFSISTGGPTTTFGATHQFHLGLWFNDPEVPFKLGCEPGKTSPVVTPFNGEQHAGIQVLNTANFPDGAGPLSHVSA